MARAAFAEHGADASLEQIARDAGLAIGTLYRHFPCSARPAARGLRAARVRAPQRGRGGPADGRPGEGFRHCLEALFSMQAGDRGFNDLMCTRFPGDPRAEALHQQAVRPR